MTCAGVTFAGTEASPELHRLAEELMGAVSRLSRSARLATRSEGQGSPLGSTGVELLRLLQDQPGLSVAQAASHLRLAANTVSTLVGQLLGQGMLQRKADPADMRVARLYVTGAAGERLAAFSERRADRVGSALADLGSDECQLLRESVAALSHLADALARRGWSQVGERGAATALMAQHVDAAQAALQVRLHGSGAEGANRRTGSAGR